MERFTALAWSWMDVLTHKRVVALRERFGDLDRALAALDEEILRALGCREETVLRALTRLEEFDAAAYDAELARRGIAFRSIEDEGYPRALRELPDPPVFLYGRGDWSVLDQPLLSLVGTREMSPYGKRVCELFVPVLVRAGFVTVSGLALGVDAEVATETLAAGGRTVAVLGHGLASIYPKANVRLADRIVDEGGLLLCEGPLDAEPDKHTFPARNRIIAGLGRATVVLEGGEKSGSLITADLALDYGRDVFSVPGPIFEPGYAGCHALIARGTAQLVTRPEEILEAFRMLRSSPAVPPAYHPQSPEESAVYGALTAMPQRAGELAERIAMPVGTLNATLTMLELSGAAKAVGPGEWVRA